jgi:hypothetical protein
MLDSSRRDVLTSAAITSKGDFVSSASFALLLRLTGIEALESEGDDTDE